MPSSDNFYLQRIEHDRYGLYWDEIKPLIERALAETEEPYNVIDIAEKISEKTNELWVIFSKDGKIEACFVTQIIRDNLAILFAGGGSMADWIYLIDTLLRWGRDNGCTTSEVHGRLGWERALKPFGFQRKKVTLKKEL